MLLCSLLPVDIFYDKISLHRAETSLLFRSLCTPGQCALACTKLFRQFDFCMLSFRFAVVQCSWSAFTQSEEKQKSVAYSVT